MKSSHFIRWSVLVLFGLFGCSSPETTVIEADPSSTATSEETITPVDPGSPADPSGPSDPSEPVDPAAPADPVDPMDPVDPTDPTDPSDPESPTPEDEGSTLELGQAPLKSELFVVPSNKQVSGFDGSTALQPLPGLSLSENSAAMPVIGSDASGEDFLQPCNISVIRESKPRNIVSRIDLSGGFDGIASLAAGCEDVEHVSETGLAPFVLPPVGTGLGSPHSVVLPTGFAFAGWEADVCDGKLASFVPYARKVNAWGANDSMLWRGPRIANSAGGFCRHESSFCPEGTVLSEISGRFRETFMGRRLSRLGGTCHRPVSAWKQKPAIASATLKEHHKIDRPVGIPANACALSCKDAAHPNGVITGFKYVTSKKLIEDLKVVTGVALLCSDLTTEGLVPGARESGVCGDPYHEFRRVTLSKGYGATGFYAQTGDLFDQLRLIAAPVDLFGEGEPVQAGQNREWEVYSHKAGGTGGAAVDGRCPDGEVMTGTTFSAGSFLYKDDYPLPVVFGIKDITCAQVDRK